jgi:DNA-binding PadR family transcriptional regulator
MNSMNPAWEGGWAMPRRRGNPARTAAFLAGRIDPPEDAGDQPAGESSGEWKGRGRRGQGGPRGRSGFGESRMGGMGGGFGPMPFGPRGRRRRTPRGDIRLAVLALVAEQPRHGYEIIQEIVERSGGQWRPSPGSVYPTVAQLEDEGLVRTEKADGRRMVQLTEAGGTYVAEHREELDKVWETVGVDADEASTALWEQLGQLHAASMQLIAAGSEEQVRTATKALADTRKTIYRLLAE